MWGLSAVPFLEAERRWRFRIVNLWTLQEIVAHCISQVVAVQLSAEVILLLGLVAELLVGAGQVDDRRVIRWAEPLGPLQ
eukprot:3280215-Pyramimonas_sp.AAC.1